MLTGRRIGEQKPGQYKGTRDSQKPVVLEGHWQEADVEEQVKHDTVNKLEVSRPTRGIVTVQNLHDFPFPNQILVLIQGFTI